MTEFDSRVCDMTPLEKAQARVAKAEDRFEKAKERHYKLLGWGTDEEIRTAVGRARNARDELQRAKKALAKLEDQQFRFAQAGVEEQES